MPAGLQKAGHQTSLVAGAEQVIQETFSAVLSAHQIAGCWRQQRASARCRALKKSGSFFAAWHVCQRGSCALPECPLLCSLCSPVQRMLRLSAVRLEGITSIHLCAGPCVSSFLQDLGLPWRVRGRGPVCLHMLRLVSQEGVRHHCLLWGAWCVLPVHARFAASYKASRSHLSPSVVHKCMSAACSVRKRPHHAAFTR